MRIAERGNMSRAEKGKMKRLKGEEISELSVTLKKMKTSKHLK